MRRALIIATREYLSFLRTPGFWISLLVMPVVGFLTGVGPQLIARSEPPPTLMILDVTGIGPTGPGAWLGQTLAGPDGYEKTAKFDQKSMKMQVSSAGRARVIVVAPTPDLAAVRTRDEAAAALRPYMTGQKKLPSGEALAAAAVISGDVDGLKVALWTPAPSVGGLTGLIGEPLDNWLRRARLSRAGVDPALAAQLDHNLAEVQDYSPKAATAGKVSFQDRLPTLAAVGLSFLLWALVMTGAGILLNTVIEEKSNRVMEVLLSSASVTEILSGKILGGAALSMTMMAFWGAIGVWLVNQSSPQMLAQIVGALLGHGLVFWFAAFFFAGYLMYASVFAAVGSFCETPREAQTMLGPIMVLLTVPIVFMGASITHPDAPALKLLAWIPFFTPFLMTIRVAAGAPLVELVGGLVMLMATTVVVVLLSGRAFRTGALATEKLDPKRFFLVLIGRHG